MNSTRKDRSHSRARDAFAAKDRLLGIGVIRDPHPHLREVRDTAKVVPGSLSSQFGLVGPDNYLIPDAQQIKQTKIDVQELKKQEQAARDLYEFVIKTHPRTPWAARAEYELNYGFGERFQEHFHDPRYRNLKNIKIPSF